MKKIEKIIAIYSGALNKNEKSKLQNIEKIKVNIKLSDDCLYSLRLEIRESDFASKEDEITFFKYQKPFVQGRLKYYMHLYNFHLAKPNLNLKKQSRFIHEILNKFEILKNKNLPFFRYYKHNDNHYDYAYFLRGNKQLEILFSIANFDRDPGFSTSHDYKASEIVAYDLLTSFYDQELNFLKLMGEKCIIKEVKPAILNDLSWTGTKTELVELLYGLNAVGAIKNGQAEMKKLAEVCKVLFNIDLGNIYKTFNEIKAREKDPTKFLDLMKIKLLQKLNSEK